jgi:hypothetical protein
MAPNNQGNKLNCRNRLFVPLPIPGHPREGFKQLSRKITFFRSCGQPACHRLLTEMLAVRGKLAEDAMRKTISAWRRFPVVICCRKGVDFKQCLSTTAAALAVVLRARPETPDQRGTRLVEMCAAQLLCDERHWRGACTEAVQARTRKYNRSGAVHP